MMPTRSFPLEQLDQRTLDFAERAAKVPVELQQLNKRWCIARW